MKILIVRLSSLGDIVHALPALAGLREQQAGAALGWAVREDLAPLLRGHPMIDRLHVAPRSWWRGRFQGAAGRAAASHFLDGLRGEGYDIAIDLMGSFKGARLARLSGAAERMGASSAREGASWSYTRTVDADPGLHAVDRYLRIAGVSGAPARFVLPAFETERARLLERLELAGLAGRPWVLVHPGCGKEANRWPLAYWSALVRGLRARGIGVVATGGMHEARMAQALGCGPDGRRSSEGPGPFLNLAGALDLPSLAALLGLSQAVIAADTGPLHLAAALGRPVLGLYGAADPERTGPYRVDGPSVEADPAGRDRGGVRFIANHPPCGPCRADRCPIGSHDCMAGISPAAVLEAALGWLEPARAATAGIAAMTRATTTTAGDTGSPA